MAKTVPVYCPSEWLVGQAEGQSNISGRQHKERYFPPAETGGIKLQRAPFVVVLGLHSSGSSCLAGCLYHLGVHLGNKLKGYYGNDPKTNCGFEASGLMKICEAALPFMAMDFTMPNDQLRMQLQRWIQNRWREANAKKTIAGGKYPQLCRMGAQLTDICSDHLLVIGSDRPIRESIHSLRRRAKRQSLEDIKEYQSWLMTGKEEFMDSIPAERRLRIGYQSLLEDPKKQIDRIIEFLPIEPEETQVAAAIKWVDPAKRHIT